MTPLKSAVWVPPGQMRIFLMAVLDVVSCKKLVLIQTFRIILS